MAMNFQLPQTVFDPATGEMLTLDDIRARRDASALAARPLPAMADSAPAQMPIAGGTQGLQMPPASPPQMTDTPSFMQRMLQSIYDSGGVKTNLGNNPRGADAFFQNLIAGGFNSAATGANRKREEFNASNEALKAQNIKDRDATRAAQKTSDEHMRDRLEKKADLTDAEKRWLERYKVEQEGRENIARIGASSRETVAGMRGPSGLTGGTMEEVRAMFTPEALDQAARMFATSMKFPSYVRGPYTFPMQMLIQNRAAEMFPGLDLTTNAANYDAAKKSLANTRQMYDAVEAFSRTAKRNADIARSYLGRLPELGSTWANMPLRELANKGAGNRDIAGFAAAIEVVVNEYAKIVNNPRLVGQMPEGAVKEMRQIVDKNATVGQILTALDVLDKDSGNRRIELEGQMQIITERLGAIAQTPEGRKRLVNDKTVEAVSNLRSQGVTTLEQFNALMADPQNRAEMRDEMGGDEGLELARRTFAAAGRRK